MDQTIVSKTGVIGDAGRCVVWKLSVVNSLTTGAGTVAGSDCVGVGVGVETGAGVDDGVELGVELGVGSGVEVGVDVVVGVGVGVGAGSAADATTPASDRLAAIVTAASAAKSFFMIIRVLLGGRTFGYAHEGTVSRRRVRLLIVGGRSETGTRDGGSLWERRSGA
jgi:hypothetical protein